MNKNNLAYKTKIITSAKSCVLLLALYSSHGISDDYYVMPIVGQWNYKLCQPTNYASHWKPECEIWREGTWSDPHCLDQKTPFPWDNESKLVSKALVYPGGVSATFHGWLSKGESIPYNGCWDGPPRFKLGFEYSDNAVPISLKQEDDSVRWVYGTRYRSVECPLWSSLSGDSCRGISQKNLGRQCLMKGNPINIVTGNKYQYTLDIKTNQPFGLTFKRYFNSQYTVPGALGYGWRHEYEASLRIDGGSVKVIMSDGRVIPFNAINGQLDEYSSDPDVDLSLSAVLDQNGDVQEYHLITADDGKEVYDAIGRLLSITDRFGRTKSLFYDITSTAGGDDSASTLDKVTNTYGTEINFQHDSEGRVVEIVNDDNLYRYSYDINGGLVKVTLPDQTIEDDDDNPVIQYHYEVEGMPYLLTGITNENGNRYATWTYDDKGRATSSEHADGVDKVTLDYTYLEDVDDQRVTVTNPLGRQTTYHFTTIHGVRKVTLIEGYPTASCEGANKSYSYDVNGNVVSKVDWNGVVTNYTYDMELNLELTRTEAVGTALERTVTTDWHPQFKLPIKITEPGKITDYSYDTKGRLLFKKVSSVQ